jgi:class 3 adenylate cyclase
MADVQSLLPSQASTMRANRNGGAWLLRSPVFPALGVLASLQLPYDVSTLNFILELLQPMAFALNPHMGGNPAAFNVPFTLLLPLWDGAVYAGGITFVGFHVIYWLTVGVLVLIVAGFATLCVHRGMVQNFALSLALPAVTHAVTTILYLPAQLILLAPISCDPSTRTLAMWPGETCPFLGDGKAAVEAMLVVGIVFAALLWLIAHLVVGCAAERSPVAPFRIKARPHALVDAQEVLLKTVLAVAFHLLVPRRFFAGFLLLAMGVFAYLGAIHALVLPYYSQIANCAKTASYFATAAAALIMYIDNRTNQPGFLQSGGLYVAVLGAGLVAARVGWIVSGLRISPVTQYLMHGTNGTFRLPHGRRTAFELAMLTGDASKLPYPRNLAASDMCFSSWATICVDIIDEATEGGEIDDVATVLRIPQVVSPTIDVVHMHTDVEVATRFAYDWTRATGLPPTPHMKSFASRVFARGEVTFPRSESVRLAFVRFIAATAPGAGRFAVALAELDRIASAADPSLSSLFQVYTYSMELRKAIGLREKTRQDLLTAAKHAHREALAQTVQLWRNAGRWTAEGHLPSLSHQCSNVGELHREAMRLYRKGIALAPDDDQMLTSYAQFLADVLHDENGQELRILAEDIASMRRSTLVKREAVSSRGSALTVISQTTTHSVAVAVITARANVARRATHRTRRNLQLVVVTALSLLCLCAGAYVATFFMFRSVSADERAARELARLQTTALELNTVARSATAAIKVAIAAGSEFGDAEARLMAQVGSLGRSLLAARNGLLFGDARLNSAALAIFNDQRVVVPNGDGTRSRGSIIDLTDRLAAAAHTLSSSPTAQWRLQVNGTTLAFILSSRVPYYDALAQMQQQLLPIQATHVDDGVATSAVIFAVMTLAACVVFSGVVYLLMVESVSKTQFLKLFARIPRHAMQQMTSKARHSLSVFAASEQDENDWAAEEETFGVPQKAPSASAAADATAPAPGAEDVAEENTLTEADLKVDITEEEVKHSALLSLVVRRGSVSVQRVSHLGRTMRTGSGGEQVAGGDHHHMPASDRELGDHGEQVRFEADFSTAWRESMVTTDTVADWDIFDAPPPHAQKPATLSAGDTEQFGARRAVLVAVLVVCATVGAAMAIGVAAGDLKNARVTSFTTSDSYEANVHQMVAHTRRFAASPTWRAYSAALSARAAVAEDLLRLRMQTDAVAAEWLRRMVEAVDRMGAICRAAFFMATRGAAMDATLAPSDFITAADLTGLNNGSIVLWDVTTMTLEDAVDLPFTNSTYDLCATCASPLPISDKRTILQRSLAAATSHQLMSDLQRVMDVASARRTGAAFDASTRTNALENASTLLRIAGGLAVGGGAGVLLLLLVSRAAVSSRRLTATAAGCLGVVSVALGITTVVSASYAHRWADAHQRGFDAADVVERTVSPTILAFHYGSAFALNPDRYEYLPTFIELADLGQEDSMMVSAELFRFFVDAGAQVDAFADARRELLETVRRAVALTARATGKQDERLRGVNFNRSAEPSFAEQDLVFVRDRLDESTAEALRDTLPADVLSVYYTTLPEGLQHAVATARRVIASDAVEAALISFRNAAVALQTTQLAKATADVKDAESKYDRFVAAIIALGVLALLCCVALLGSLVLGAIASVKANTEGTDRLFDSDFRPLLRISLLLPIAIVLGFAAVFGTCTGLLRLRQDALEVTSMIFLRTTYAQAAALNVGDIGDELTSARPLASRIQALQNSLSNNLNMFETLRVKGYFGSAGRLVRSANPALDEILFGPTTPREVRVPSGTACFDSYARATGNQADLDSVLFASAFRYRRLLAYPAFQLASDATVRASALLLVSANNAAQNVASARLREVSDEYYKALANIQRRDMLTVALVYAAVAVIIIVTVFAAVMPLELAIDEDVETIALLLSTLPDDVKSNVPELSEYFNAGTFGDDEKKNLAQSEQLLQNILPPVISRRLKSGETPIADDHRSVTVVFAALCHFDQYSAKMEAREMVVYLNRLIVTFDDIVDQLELEKIKTIGDIYFLCGGLTTKTAADHPLRAVECGLNFMEALEEFASRTNMPELKLRVGVHTGAAVAGVIGSSKVAYDLWGDTVNTASRMQSTGKEGKMQLHASTHARVKEYFSFAESFVNAKGKGQLKTYLWAGRKGLPSPYHGKVNWRKTLQ